MEILGYYTAYTLAKSALFVYIMRRYIDTITRRLLSVHRIPDRVPVHPFLVVFSAMAIPVIGWSCVYVAYQIGSMEEEEWEKWREERGI